MESETRTIDLGKKEYDSYVMVDLDLENTIMLVVANGFEEASVWLNKEQTEALVINLEDLLGKLK